MSFLEINGKKLIAVDAIIRIHSRHPHNPCRATLLVTLFDTTEVVKQFLQENEFPSLPNLMVEITGSVNAFYHSNLPIAPDVFHTMILRDRKCRLLLNPKKVPIKSHYEPKLFVSQIRLVDYYYVDTLPIDRTMNAVQIIERLSLRYLEPRHSAARTIQRWWGPIYRHILQKKLNKSVIQFQALWKGYRVRRKIRRIHTLHYRTKIQSLIECCICLDTLKRPVTNTCGHSWCSECHQGLLTSTREESETYYASDKTRCPLCREPVTTDLRPNLRLDAIITMLRM